MKVSALLNTDPVTGELLNPLSAMRPAWNSTSLATSDDAAYCGRKPGHFKKTRGMPGRLLNREFERRSK